MTSPAPSQNVSDPLITRTADYVQGLLSGEGTGHDWWHIERVWRNARMIGQAEGADLRQVELAALLHDIADWKFHDGDLTAGPKAARQWLESQQVDEPTIHNVCQIIEELSYKGSGVPTPMSTLEGGCVQDADRLDAIGAIGIARCFAYGGHKGRPLHDPTHPPQQHDSPEAYFRSGGPSLNHFYEKLFLLKDRMQTATGRRLAEARHQYLEDFVQQFLHEWHGDQRSGQ